MITPTGPVPARIMIIGDIPEPKDFQHKQPFSSPSGIELTRMLSEAGISRAECFLTYLIREPIPGKWVNGKYLIGSINEWLPLTKKAQLELAKNGGEYLGDHIVSKQVKEGFHLLESELEQANPDVIITLGNASLWALTGKLGIQDWRGSHLSYKGIPLIPTLTPYTVQTAWNQRTIVVSDLKRAKGILDNPNRELPEKQYILNTSYQATIICLNDLRKRAIQQEGSILSVDIETDIRTKFITCIGIAWTPEKAICIPFVENNKNHWLLEEEFQIIKALRSLLTDPLIGVIGQNFIFDTQYIYNHWKFVPNFIGDTMFLQHVCFPSMPKKLGFLSSLYCKEHYYWKNMVGDMFKKDS